MWASAFVVIRHVAHDVSPGALGAGRLLVAALVVAPLVLRRGWVRPTRREWSLLALGGVGWFGVYNLALNAGERYVDAGTAAMIIQVGPVIVALLAVPLFGERLHAWLIAGMVVGFAGVAVIARGSSDGRRRQPAGRRAGGPGRRDVRRRRADPEGPAAAAPVGPGRLRLVPHRRADLPALLRRPARASSPTAARSCGGSSTSASSRPRSPSRRGPTPSPTPTPAPVADHVPRPGDRHAASRGSRSTRCRRR